MLNGKYKIRYEGIRKISSDFEEIIDCCRSKTKILGIYVCGGDSLMMGKIVRIKITRLKHWIIGSLDHRIIGSSDHWIIGSLDDWNIGSLDHRIIGSSDHWIIESSDH